MRIQKGHASFRHDGTSYEKITVTVVGKRSVTLSAFAQGTINFYNNGIARPFTTDAAGNRTYTYDPNVHGTQLPESGIGITIRGRPQISADGSTYRAGIFQENGGVLGTVGPGSAFTVGLFLSSDLFWPLATTPFRGNNNFDVFQNDVPVTLPPGNPVGSSRNFTIRVWETGQTWYTSYRRGEASFLSGPLGGPVPGNPDAAPASLLGFNGFTMAFIPEPSTTALAVLGAGALLLLRGGRKKNSELTATNPPNPTPRE